MSEDKIKVWPAPGRVVPNQDTGAGDIQPGDVVRRTRFVERRINDGDLLLNPPSESEAAKDAPNALKSLPAGVADEAEQKPASHVETFTGGNG